MTTKNFVVKNGLTVGNVTIDATSGNLSGAGNANLGNAVVANFFIGSGANLSNIPGANITGNISGNISNAAHAITANTVVDNAQPNITSVGTLSSLSVTGNISAGGLLTSNLYYANGNPWDFQLPGGANTEVQFNDNGDFGGSANFTFNKTTNVLTLSGNLSAANVSGGNLVSANFVTGTLTTAAQPNITSTGTLSSLNVSGNANVGNIGGGAGVFTANLSANNLSTTNSITAGNGLQVTTGALSVLAGNLDVTGNLNVTGNVNYSNVTDLVVGDPLIFIGANNAGDTYDLGFVAEYNNGAANVHTGLARNAADKVWTFFDGVTQQPTTTVDWANATYPAVKLGNLITTGTANIVGNANVGNLGTAGTITATGNITANYFIGNGSQLTGIDATAIQNGTANVRTFNNANVAISASGTANVVIVTGTGANIAGTLDVSGNANAGNVGATNFVGTNANVTTVNASYVNSSGNLGLGANSNANVVVVTGTGANVTGTLGVSGNLTTANATVNLELSGNTANFSGNVTVPNLTVNTNIAGNTANFSGNVTVPNLTVNLNVSGNTANFSGNISAANANLGNVASANYLTGTLTTGAQPNITSTGTLSALAVSGNITAGNVYANGGTIGAANLTGTLTTAAQPNVTSLGTLTSLGVSGNVTAGNVKLTTGLTSNRTNVAVVTNTVIDEFNPATFRTAKYIISASGDNGYQSVETLLVHDGTNAYITIYGSVSSNVSTDIIDITSNINGVSGNVAVYATGTGANTIVNLVASYIKT
jgi:hypothetical protein